MGYLLTARIEFDNIDQYDNAKINQLVHDLFETANFRYFFTDEDWFKNYIKKRSSFIAHQVKWYGIDEDLEAISKLYPDLKIVAEVKGEDDDDYRMIYAFNGQVEVCKGEVKITYPKRTLW